MPSPSDGSRRALIDLIAAFTEPGDVHPGLAARVVAHARELLEPPVVDPRARMPRTEFPVAAAFEDPDGPPVPPGAL